MNSRALKLGLYAALSLIVLFPVLTVQVPALGDTINHVARMHILASGAGSPARHFYAVRWTLTPYLAMDAIVPILAQVMPVMVAARVFIGACLLMPVVAVAVLHWEVRGRIGLVPAAAFLLSQNTLFGFGFLNFLFMSGLAVMLFAGWIGTATWPRWRRVPLFALGVLLLYLGHVFACAGYCLAVAGFEIARAIRGRFQPWRMVVLDWLTAAAQAVPALLLVPFFDRGQVAVGAAVTDYGSLAARLMAIASPVLWRTDQVGGLVVLAVFAGLLLLGVRSRIDASVWPAALLLALVSLAVPHVTAGVWGTDLRLPLIACMLALGGLSVRLPRRSGALVLAAVTLLVVLKSVDGSAMLWHLDQRITETRQVLKSLPAGSRLLVMDDTGLLESEPGVTPNALWHIPMLAVIDRDAFLPYLFTGFMTVHPRDAVRDGTTPSGRPVDAAELADGLRHADVPGAMLPDGRGGRIYWYGWPHKFDYLLVQHATSRTALPGDLQLVAASAVADLYKIKPVPSPQPNP